MFERKKKKSYDRKWPKSAQWALFFNQAIRYKCHRFHRSPRTRPCIIVALDLSTFQSISDLIPDRTTRTGNVALRRLVRVAPMRDKIRWRTKKVEPGRDSGYLFVVSRVWKMIVTAIQIGERVLYQKSTCVYRVFYFICIVCHSEKSEGSAKGGFSQINLFVKFSIEKVNKYINKEIKHNAS